VWYIIGLEILDTAHLDVRRLSWFSNSVAIGVSGRRRTMIYVWARDRLFECDLLRSGRELNDVESAQRRHLPLSGAETDAVAPTSPSTSGIIHALYPCQLALYDCTDPCRRCARRADYHQ